VLIVRFGFVVPETKDRCPIVLGALAYPLLMEGSKIFAVSPGSRIPSLSPVASSIIRVFKSKFGA